MLIIGLTGGIASGKSTVVSFFAKLGVGTIDADHIARQLVAPQSPTLKQIEHHFGRDFIDADGALIRSKLRQLIFTDPQAKQWLEQLLHPLIRAEIQRQLATTNAPYVIIEIPLLLESSSSIPIDRTLVVDAPEALQIQRMQQRPDMSTVLAKKIIAQQASRNQRLAAADDVVHNDGTLEELEQHVLVLHQRYLQLNANR